MVHRPLTGVDVVAIERTETGSAILTSFMFGLPDPPWRGRAPRKIKYRGRTTETGGAELLQFQPGEVAVAIGRIDVKPPTHAMFVDPQVVYEALARSRLPVLARPQGERPAVVSAFTGFFRAVEAGAERVELEERFHRSRSEASPARSSCVDMDHGLFGAVASSPCDARAARPRQPERSARC